MPGVGDTASVTNPSVITVSQDIAAAIRLSAETMIRPSARDIAVEGGMAASEASLPTLTWKGGAIPTNSVLLFPDAALADVTGAEGTVAGSSVALAYRDSYSRALFFTNDGANATFQLQFFENSAREGKFVKCVKVELAQQPDGIYGRAVYARYAQTFYDMAGRIDFDTIGTDNGTNYFASSLMLFRAPELSVADTPAPQPLIHTSFITASSTLLFPGATLANYHSAAALMAGGSFDDDYADAHIFYFVNDGATASFQLQRRDRGIHTKCLKIELTQQPDGIYGRAVYAKYHRDAYQVGFDFDSGGDMDSIAPNLTAGGYGCPAFMLLPAHATSSYLPTETPAATLATGDNAKLDRVTDFEAYIGGSGVNNRDLLPAQPFHWQRTSPTTATVQFQAAEANATYCVKVELTEDAAGLSARALYAKSLVLPESPHQDRRGIDFDLAGDELPLATGSDTANGVNIVRLQASLTTVGLTARQPVDLPGRVTLGNAAFSPVQQFPARVALSGVASLLALDTLDPVTLPVAPVGRGALRIAAPAGAPQSAVTNPVHNVPLPKAPAADTVLTGVNLSEITDAVVTLGGLWISDGRGSPVPANVYHWRVAEDGTVAFQAQVFDDVHTKCVKVRLAQQGSDIVASCEYASYVLSRFLTGFDFDTNPGATTTSIATNNTAEGYGVMSLALIQGGTPLPATLSGGTAFAGPITVERRTAYISAPIISSPAPTSIQVRDGATLVTALHRSPDAGGLGNGCPLVLSGDSILYPNGLFTLGMSRPITLNASECRLYSFDIGDSGQYANNMTLQNGARLVGNRVRVGNAGAAHWLILGPAASTNAAGFTLVNNAQKAPFTVECHVDFAVTASMRDYPQTGLYDQPLVKAGPASMILAASGSTFGGPITVRGGALCLEAPNALAGTNTLAVLPGAELRITATQNVPLTVSLSTNAVLTLATADAFTGDIALTLDSAIVRPQMPAVLNLAGETLFTGTSVLDFGETPLAIGPALFDPDATVTLTGNLETDTLRFQQQLTSTQLGCFVTPSGRCAWQTADGYIRDTARGILFTLQ